MMSETIARVRQIEPEDHPEWLRMRATLWPHASIEELREESSLFFSGERTDEVLVSPRPGTGLQGFVELSIRPYVDGCFTNNVGYIEGWYVDHDMRGQGIGRDLVRAAEEWARSKGCTEMGSDTEFENEASQKAHQALGYKVTERLVLFRKEL